MRPKNTNLSINIPAFLSKLWKIVNDPETDHLICWSKDGRSFIIQNQAEFWYSLLPIYYKHNNMSSFIRQLNMYGFHKISSEHGEVEFDRGELKFYHPFFHQDQPQLMKHIKRKITTSKTATTPEEKVGNFDQINKVLVDVKQLRGRQESVDNQLAQMKQENAALWRELALMRQKHLKQQQIVNKLIHFLVHIVNPNRADLGGIGVKRRYQPLAINDGKAVKSPRLDNSGPTIHELDTESNIPENLLLSEEQEDEPKETITQEVIDSPATSSMSLSDQNLLDIPIIEDDINSPATLSSDILLTDELDSNAENLLDEAEANPSTSATGKLNLESVMNEKELLDVANEYIVINDLQEETEQKDNNTATPNPSVSNDFEELNELAMENNDEETSETPSKHLINPDMQNVMISNIVSGTKPPVTIASKPSVSEVKNEKENKTKDLAVAKRKSSPFDGIKLNSPIPDDFGNHLETTQGELDTIKDILFDGYTLDANALLGTQINNGFDGINFQLFNSEENFPLELPSYSSGEAKSTNKDNNTGDPMMSGSGSELMTYNANVNQPFVLDFENLFETPDSGDAADNCSDEGLDLIPMTDEYNQLATPIVVKKEPVFPVPAASKSNTDAS